MDSVMMLVLAVIMVAMAVSVILAALEVARRAGRDQEPPARRAQLGRMPCVRCGKLHERSSVWCSAKCEKEHFNL